MFFRVWQIPREAPCTKCSVFKLCIKIVLNSTELFPKPSWLVSVQVVRFTKFPITFLQNSISDADATLLLPVVKWAISISANSGHQPSWKLAMGNLESRNKATIYRKDFWDSNFAIKRWNIWTHNPFCYIICFQRQLPQ